MQKWEYLMHMLEDHDLGNMQFFLDQKGDEGWELVYLNLDLSSSIFKRLK
jgi:hypothetical protein